MALNDLVMYHFYGYRNISGYLLKSIFQIYLVRYMSLVYDASFQICACLQNFTKYDPSKPWIVGRGDRLSYVPRYRGSPRPMTADLKGPCTSLQHKAQISRGVSWEGLRV